jgi:hypothetical protein
MTRQCGWTGNWCSTTVVHEIAPPIVQMKHGRSSSSPKPPGTFFTVGSRPSLSWASSRKRLFSDWKSLSAVERRSSAYYWVFAFPGRMPRGLLCSNFVFVSSRETEHAVFARERKRDHWIGLVHCWVFNSSFPCRPLLTGRPRSLCACFN